MHYNLSRDGCAVSHVTMWMSRDGCAVSHVTMRMSRDWMCRMVPQFVSGFS